MKKKMSPAQFHQVEGGTIRKRRQNKTKTKKKCKERKEVIFLKKRKIEKKKWKHFARRNTRRHLL
jgi:hypothetical protein